MSFDFNFTSSQSLGETSQVFCHLSGHQAQIFVDSGCEDNRPKLVRHLRKHGASICLNPSNSQYILVDSTSKSGRRFIRDWGSDSTKVVLDYRWAWKSIDSGRMLTELDNWGDFRALDDGNPIEADGEDTVEDRPNPLPTPRLTPTTVAPSLSTRQQAPKLQEQVIFQQPETHPHCHEQGVNDLFLSPQAFRQEASEGLSHHPNNSNVLANGVQGHPAQAMYGVVPTQTNPFSGPTNQPMTYPNLSQQVPHSQVAEGNSIPPSFHSQSPQINLLSQVPVTPNATYYHQYMSPQQQADPYPQSTQINGSAMQHTHFQQGNMYSQPISMNGILSLSQQQMSQQMSQQMISSIQDILRLGNQSFFNQMTGADTGQSHFFPNVQPSASVDSPPPTFESSESKFDLHNDSHDVSPSADTSPTASSKTLPPSISRKARSSPAPYRKRPGKAAVNQSRRKRSSITLKTPKSTPGLTDSEEAQTTSNDPKSFPRLPGQIFTSNQGEPLNFFVQVDFKKRLEVVTMIKKNQGKITNSNVTADYAVLYPASKDFSNLLRSTIAAGRPAIKSSFVHDCVMNHSLLDCSHYLFEDTSPRKGTHGRAPALHDEHKDRKNVEKDKKIIKARKRGSSKRQRKSPGDEELEATLGTPSPSPPPEDDRVLTVGGHYMFTEDERLFAGKYMEFLLHRDPSISLTAISRKLFRKVPHHPAGSWNTYVSRTARVEVDRIRSSAIKHSKTQTAFAGQLPEPGLDQPSPSKRMKPSQSPDDPALALSVEEKQDLDFISKFFADGSGDDSDDEGVWAKLEERRSCKTAPTWPDFYESRKDRVGTEIQRLTKETEEEAAVQMSVIGGESSYQNEGVA